MRVLALCALSCFLFVSPATNAAAVNRIVVRRVVLEGVKKLPVAERQRIIRDIQQHVSSNGDLDAVVERVRFDFQRDGFFRVFVADPGLKVVARSRSQETIDIAMEVEEGEQYRLKGIRFSSSNDFPASVLRAQFPIANGDIFDRQKIGLGLDALRKLYGAKGYINFSAVPETEEDYDRHTVALLIYLDTGAVFHFGKLVVAGEESQPGARDKLLRIWKKYEGQVYDLSALQRFLRELHARPQIKPSDIFEVSQDPAAHVATVRIVLSPGCKATVDGLCKF